MILKIIEENGRWTWLEADEITCITKKFTEGNSTCEYSFYGNSIKVGDFIRWVTIIDSTGVQKHAMVDISGKIQAYVLNNNGKTIDKLN